MHRFLDSGHFTSWNIWLTFFAKERERDAEGNGDPEQRKDAKKNIGVEVKKKPKESGVKISGWILYQNQFVP